MTILTKTEVRGEFSLQNSEIRIGKKDELLHLATPRGNVRDMFRGVSGPKGPHQAAWDLPHLLASLKGVGAGVELVPQDSESIVRPVFSCLPGLAQIGQFWPIGFSPVIPSHYI